MKRAKQNDPALHDLIEEMWVADGDMPTGPDIAKRARDELNMAISVDTAERARIVVRIRREDAAREKDVVTVDWDTLPGRMKDKLATMRRQVRRELEAEFEPRVVTEVQNRMDYAIKSVERRERVAARVVEGRKGVFTAAQYRMLKACLHPDSRDSISAERLAEAFRLFSDADVSLMDNKEHRVSSLPSMEELLKRRRKMA